MFMTRLREGRISYQKEDVEYHKPEFVVPDYKATDLLHKHSKTSDAKLVILMNEKDQLVCQVGKKKDKGYEGKDAVVRYINWQVPDDVVANLMRAFQEVADAELFVLLDSQANLKCIVQVGATRYTGNFMCLINEGGQKTCYRPSKNWGLIQM